MIFRYFQEIFRFPPRFEADAGLELLFRLVLGLPQLRQAVLLGVRDDLLRLLLSLQGKRP